MGLVDSLMQTTVYVLHIVSVAVSQRVVVILVVVVVVAVMVVVHVVVVVIEMFAFLFSSFLPAINSNSVLLRAGLSYKKLLGKVLCFKNYIIGDL